MRLEKHKVFASYFRMFFFAWAFRMCFSHVLCACVFSMCFSHVFFRMCFWYVLFACVSGMCFWHVCFACVFRTCFSHVFFACVCRVHFLQVLFACVHGCAFGMFSLHIFTFLFTYYCFLLYIFCITSRNYLLFPIGILIGKFEKYDKNDLQENHKNDFQE